MIEKDIYILGIESSCDDSCVAIIQAPRNILSNIVISQNNEHAVFAGVVPEIAARSHLQNLESAVKLALSEAKLNLIDISAVAATTGPGLIGGVIVGSVLGQALASSMSKPFIAINHLEGHALTARLSHDVSYPFLLLLLSGGHCQFVAVRELGKYKIIGQTIDDAVGEAFDKVAKMLKLPFPGGVEIEKRAKLGNIHKYILPRPIINHSGCDLSFSGLKTAVRTLIMEHECLTEEVINDIAASFQYTVGEILANKLAKAIAIYENTTNLREEESRTIVVAGGVAANQYIIDRLRMQSSDLNYSLISPPAKLCTDNAAMIAFTGLERLKAGMIEQYSSPRARWSLEELG